MAHIILRLSTPSALMMARTSTVENMTQLRAVVIGSGSGVESPLNKLQQADVAGMEPPAFGKYGRVFTLTNVNSGQYRTDTRRTCWTPSGGMGGGDVAA